MASKNFTLSALALKRLFFCHAATTIAIESIISLQGLYYSVAMALLAALVFALSFFRKSYKYTGWLVCLVATLIAAKGILIVMFRGPTLFDHLSIEFTSSWVFPLNVYFIISTAIHLLSFFAFFSDGEGVHREAGVEVGKDKSKEDG